MKKTNTKTIVMIGMFAAVLAVLSQISIPMPSGVPVTLQTFAVALTGFILGWKYGAISVGIYILLGTVGVPVFSNFSGGLGALFGKTGGFIWGFLFLAGFCGVSHITKKKDSHCSVKRAGTAHLSFTGSLSVSDYCRNGILGVRSARLRALSVKRRHFCFFGICCWKSSIKKSARS